MVATTGDYIYMNRMPWENNREDTWTKYKGRVAKWPSQAARSHDCRDRGRDTLGVDGREVVAMSSDK